MTQPALPSIATPATCSQLDRCQTRTQGGQRIEQHQNREVRVHGRLGRQPRAPARQQRQHRAVARRSCQRMRLHRVGHERL